VKTFAIRGKILRSGEETPWHFIYLNEKLSRQITDTMRPRIGNAPFVKVRVSTGRTIWQTSLFRTKDGPYLLPIRADVRAREGIQAGDSVTITCTLR